MTLRKLGPAAPGTYTQAYRKSLEQYLKIKLAFLHGYTIENDDDEFLSLSKDLIDNFQEKKRLLADHFCPVDMRIQSFLDTYFSDIESYSGTQLPKNTLVLDRHGLARELSIPKSKSVFQSKWVKSYRIEQGIVNNPKSDRRTTKGVFHIVEDGLPIPADKKSVPRCAFVGLLKAALNPPKEISDLPWLEGEGSDSTKFVSLLLRPKVVPEVKNVFPGKKMEIRFFVPGGLVSNLDFVESIFGNAGDPELPINDSALDPEHWTGHTGCVILAPYLSHLTKKELGLPKKSDATELQIRDGMCWESPTEKYNDGSAFKICCRNEQGVIVTIIADNYYGYCKKEVKTQIGYSANLFGLAEEEHSGGAMVYPSYHLGSEFHHKPREGEHTFKKVLKNISKDIQKCSNYAIDKKNPNLFYVPESCVFDIETQSIRYNDKIILKLLPQNTYMLPTGYRVKMEKHPAAASWRLIGTEPEGTLCHKPSTVSGGGKSEISKAFSDSYIFGPFFVDDLKNDLDQVQKIFDKDFFHRFKDEWPNKKSSRHLLHHKRSLGSVIKLLTVSSDYKDSYNTWLKKIPSRILSLLYIVKRFYKPEWKRDWQQHFSVDVVNGSAGHELKLNGVKLSAVYVRMGFDTQGAWRTFKLRQDFIASEKLQVEDDITASIVINADSLTNKNKDYSNKSVKMVENCEYRLFQRPDDAIHRGFDHQAESDLAGENVFISNFEPMNSDQAKELIEDSVNFENYTQPMKDVIKRSAKNGTYFISSAHPRLVDGKPTKNPRYLQNRQDLVSSTEQHISDTGTRLKRNLKSEEPVYTPVNAVLTGHRNNPPEKENGVRSLAVYNPLHYLEFPELFMDFISSLTGKSPSTTGAGSEGSLTKGPFNALCSTTDLNNALVSCLLTDYGVFCSAAGHIGPNLQINHDVSLFIPELWGRISVAQRDPKFLIKEGYLEKVKDFKYEGKKVLASRLGYRISAKFVQTFMGKIFDNPTAVFNEEILKPEKQDLESYADGINNICEAHEQVANNYFEDGSIEFACPPLKALLHIMAKGNYEGKTLASAEIREMFTRESLLKSSWYADRLKAKQESDQAYWENSIAYLQEFISKEGYDVQTNSLALKAKLRKAKATLKEVMSENYLKSLEGTIGLNPIFN